MRYLSCPIAAMTDAISLPRNVRVFDITLDSGMPLSLCVSTCPTAGCSCREATIIGADDNDKLRSQLEIVENTLATTENADTFEAAIGPNILVFDLNIDAALPLRVRCNDDELYLSDPTVLAVVDRIDGEMLDTIGALWFFGKGLPNPESVHQPPASIKGWAPQNAVAWEHAFLGCRHDMYLLDDRLYQAVDYYCVDPTCGCRDVSLEFYGCDITADTFIGAIDINAEGQGQPSDCVEETALIQRLWSRFQKRYPRYRTRFDARGIRMREFGELLTAHYAETHKPRVWVPTSRKRKKR
jgi:hypothetical protein